MMRTALLRRIGGLVAVLLAAGTAWGAPKGDAMGFVDLAKPDRVLLDGQPSERVGVSPDGAVTLAGGEASTITLVWKAVFPGTAKVYGSTWERTYGKTAWRTVSDRRKPNGGNFAWYVLVADGTRTDGYGVMVQPNAFASWRVGTDRLELLIDVRAGSNPVRLGERKLEAVRLVSRRGQSGENAFAAARAFCRVMCPKPRLPKAPVYGFNDWYCAYGENEATEFFADVRHFMKEFDRLGPCANRPFAVVDAYWETCDDHGWSPDAKGEWTAPNPRWGMPMDRVAAELKRMNVRPGIWYRPLHAWQAMPADWWLTDRAGRKQKLIDPTAPGLGEAIERDLARFRAWGYELVKIDFLTLDWNGNLTGGELRERVVGDCATWRDRSRTSAEAILGLYRRMRQGAGDMTVIGCNAIDHFAAGLFELQRTGHDVCSFSWLQTRENGVNALGLRAHHNNIFYQCDPDCVCLMGEGFVPWGFNRQWLDAIARSGASLFVSWPRTLAPEGGPVLRAIAEAWHVAANTTETAEPLDWQDGFWPRYWRFADGSRADYEWRFRTYEDSACGTTSYDPPEGRRTIRLESGDCAAEVDWTGKVVLSRCGKPVGTVKPVIEANGRRDSNPTVWELRRSGDRVICSNSYDGGLIVVFEISLMPSGELKVRQDCALSHGTANVGVDFGGVRTKPVPAGLRTKTTLEWTLPVPTFVNDAPADVRAVPPRGWNSWCCYGASATEADVMANADAMAKHLLPYGYAYCVLDIRWTVQNESLVNVMNKKDPVYTLDGYGRYLPAPNRFPSSIAGGASRGFKVLADYVHGKGLKFGIHIMRGVPKEAVARKLPVKGANGVTCDKIVKGPNPECDWLGDNLTVDATKPGAQEYYDSIVALYAEWGVDFIKCDDLSSPYHGDEIEMLAKAIKRCGRPIVLSTSPGPTPVSEAGHVCRHANMWRMVNDVWDAWEDFLRLVPAVEAWCREAEWGDGRWPDCDLLALGTLRAKGFPLCIHRDRLTSAERRSFMTLWSICRSPLMFSGVCPDLAYQPDVLALLTDPLCLEANAKGCNPRVVRRTAAEMVMESAAPDGGRYVALFNLSSTARTVEHGAARATLPPHGAKLLLLPQTR